MVTQFLDITPEKKDLQKQISELEETYVRILKRMERLKEEIADFESLYDSKVKRLYDRLNQLQSLLFKYRQISENVDELFSFSEAQKIFDDTMKDRRARMEDEFKRKKYRTRNIPTKRDTLPAKDRAELKKIYRKLAHLFHPDKNGGDEEMMKKINEAYREGNLQALVDLDLEYLTQKNNDSLEGLQHRLISVNRLIEKTNKEIRLLQRSDMYILRRNLLKKNKQDTGTILDTLAKELRKEILSHEEEVQDFIDKYGLNDEDL